MPTVRAFTVDGFVVKFYTRDEHEPPHFHVVKPGHWEISVNFTLCTAAGLDYSLKWPKYGTGPTAPECKKLLNQVLAHRHALLVEWEESRPR